MDLTREEMLLRRRLLFRLLAEFDFEHPAHHYEQVTPLLPPEIAEGSAGQLVFAAGPAREKGAAPSLPPPLPAARGAPRPVSFA